MTLRARLTCAHLALLTLCLSGFGFGVYAYLSTNLQDQQAASVREYGDYVTQLLSGSVSDVEGIRSVMALAVPRADSQGTGGTEDSWVQVEVVSPETIRAIVYKSETLPEGSLPSVEEHRVATTRTPELGHVALYARRFAVEADTGQERVLRPLAVQRAAPSVATPERFEVKVTVARSLESVDASLALLRTILIGGGLLVLAVAAVLGLGVSAALLQPLERMRSATRRIGGERDFHLRLPVGNPRHELGRLSDSVNQMLSELEQSHASLMSTLEAQRRFVGDASHELRTPVTAIRTNVEFLRRAPDADQRDRAEALADVEAEVQRMEQLIGNLLALARLEAAAAQDRGPLRLDQLLAGVHRDATRMAPPGVEVVLRTPAGGHGTWVSGNREDLRRAVWNLVENALKYLQQPPPEPQLGAGGITRRASAGTVTIRLAAQGGFAVVTVRDTGIGISADDQRMVFDRFWRATQTRGQAGSGLGLAITKWVAEAHGGSVAVSSALGGGSTFTVWLPLIAAPPASSSQGGQHRQDGQDAAADGGDAAPSPQVAAPQPQDAKPAARST